MSIWSSTGVCWAGCTCSARCWPGRRVRFVRFADNERADTTLALLAECFETLGGVPGVVLADRMGCLKGGVVANKVVPTGAVRALRRAPRVPARLLRGRRPGVEGHRGEPGRLRQDRPDDPRRRAGSGEPFADVAAANAAAAAWCVEVNAAVHAEICAVPAERLVIERELLAAAALAAGQHRPASVTRKVDRLSCVRFGSARYSVPVRFIGAQVRLRVDADRSLAIIAGPGEGEWSPSTGWSRRARRRSTTITTAGRGRRRGGRCARKPWRRRRSARSARPRRRSSPVPPRPATPGWGRSWPS